MNPEEASFTRLSVDSSHMHDNNFKDIGLANPNVSMIQIGIYFQVLKKVFIVNTNILRFLNHSITNLSKHTVFGTHTCYALC